MDDLIPGFGANKSPTDIRTFAYPTQAYPSATGGHKYDPPDIENQAKVGICTANSLTENARKALGRPFSADFQYLIQKKYYDNNWEEGSSIFNAFKAAKGIGFLPESEWKWTTQEDRKLPYDLYIAKLKSVPDAEIARLILIANKTRLKAYASVPVNRDAMARAIDESKSGIIVRFVLGKEWYTDTAGNVTWDKDKIQPLRPPKEPISGHAIITSNYAGGSFRVANTWSSAWCDGGTAYYLLRDYTPTEAWIPYYDTVPDHVAAAVERRASWSGKLLDLVQKAISWLKA